MRKAVIDLGTNTFHLLIADISGDTFTVVDKRQIPVKLGEGGILNHRIAPAAFERGLQALGELRELLDLHACSSVRIVATSAIRSAGNGGDFIREARARYGFAIEVIDGLREAEFIAKGVFKSLPPMDEPFLIMDIGGGSVEFILCNGREMIHKQSLDIGAARLVAEFHPQDPIPAASQALLRNHLETQLSSLMHRVQQEGIRLLVGSAGSFESILDLIPDLLKKEPEVLNANCYRIPIADFDAINQRLIASTREEREKMNGLVDYRVEMIVVASILIETVIRMGRMEEIYCSLYSLKEGLLESGE